MSKSATSNVRKDDFSEQLPFLLLVDDHRVTAEIERNYFVSAGFRVLLASTPSEVQELVSANSIDLLMIDVGFAKEQGLQLVKAAKRSTANRSMKVLVTSVVGSPDVRSAAMQAGADAFLTKPAPRPRFLKEIKHLTEQKARDSERVRKALEVELLLGGEAIKAQTLDLSEDGVHLAGLKTPPDTGTALGLRITLPNIPKPIDIQGVVVRHTAEGFGVKFQSISKMAKRNLDKFLLMHSMESHATQYYL